MSQAVAVWEDVVKDYPLGLLGRRTVRAVAGVHLQVRAGEVFGLLGPNRAGKTTLVKMLLSLCRPTAGRVERLGRPIADRRTLQHVGYVHENHAFPRYLSAAALLRYYAALSYVPAEEADRRVGPLLDRVGLGDRRAEPIAGFSKGMLQRLGVAQALVNEPELLVLDEPNEGLDLLGRKLVADLIKEQRQRGRTVLLVSHVLTEVEQLCDRVGVIVGGKLAYLGTIADLKKAPADGGPARTFEQALQHLYESAP